MLKQLPKGYNPDHYERTGGFVTEPHLVRDEKSRLEKIANMAPKGTTHWKGYGTPLGQFEVEYHRLLPLKQRLEAAAKGAKKLNNYRAQQRRRSISVQSDKRTSRIR